LAALFQISPDVGSMNRRRVSEGQDFVGLAKVLKFLLPPLGLSPPSDRVSPHSRSTP
jgi:hypothetical protein